MRCGDHDSDDGLGFSGSDRRQDSHTEHDVIESLGARAEARGAVSDARLRVRIRIQPTRGFNALFHHDFQRKIQDVSVQI